MKKVKLVSVIAAAAIMMSSAAICAQAASPQITAAKTTYSAKYASNKSVGGVYTVKKMPYNYNATAAATVTVKGSGNQNSAYKITKGANVCVINVIKVKGSVLYESVYKAGGSYIHGYISAGALNFRYQSWYTSINKQPVYSLSGKTKVGYLNKGQKATKLYMVGKKCAVLFDTSSGKNTGFGIVNYRGSKF